MKQDQRALAFRAANFMFSRAGQSCVLGFVISAGKMIPVQGAGKHGQRTMISAGKCDVI